MQFKVRKGVRTSSVRFYTRSLPCFTNIFHLFYKPVKPGYKNVIKIVPQDIFGMLNPLALAHWAMGDGAKTKSGFILCTDSYSFYDVQRLMYVLKFNLGIECSIIGLNGYPRLYIKKTLWID